MLHLSGDRAESSARRALWVGRILIGMLSLVFVVLLARVFQLQSQPEPMIAALLDTQASQRTLLGRRGAIVDRRGRLLAITRVAQRLFVDPHLILDHNTFPERVGHALTYDSSEIARTLFERSNSRYIVLDRRLDDRRRELLQDIELSGLASEDYLVRDYPQGTVAGQVVGFVGSEGQGLEGMERTLNAQLLSAPGRLRYLRDAQHRPLWVEEGEYQPHQDGRPIQLSIDITIQTIAEKHLAAAVEQYGAESGQLVVLQPFTGEILAIANYPPFDPNEIRTSTPEQRRNRVVTDMFEPGSIFKPFVWAALTERSAARPGEMIDCTTAGWWKPERGPVLRDASPHGMLSWDGVLIKSSNIGMGKVAERVGNAALHEIVADFGFGVPTGSELPGEVGGLLRPVRNWSATDLTRVPMGHGVAVTPLQMVRAFAVIANDGLLVTPTIYPLDSALYPRSLPRRILRPDVAAHTRWVLGRAVSEGTGRRAISEQYPLFGKTGTAQLPDLENGGYHQGEYVSSFVAGAPLDSPRLVVGCFIQKPDRSKGHYGGIVAAPPVRDVIEESLRYLGVPPVVTDDGNNGAQLVTN